MSRPHGSLPDKHIREVQQRVAQQKALVHRMIVQGTPTQAAEDRLGELQQTLSRMNSSIGEIAHSKSNAQCATIDLVERPAARNS